MRDELFYEHIDQFARLFGLNEKSAHHNHGGLVCVFLETATGQDRPSICRVVYLENAMRVFFPGFDSSKIFRIWYQEVVGESEEEVYIPGRWFCHQTSHSMMEV